jgi:hypothetical protein
MNMVWPSMKANYPAISDQGQCLGNPTLTVKLWPGYTSPTLRGVKRLPHPNIPGLLHKYDMQQWHDEYNEKCSKPKYSSKGKTLLKHDPSLIRYFWFSLKKIAT